jgi:O-antigen/teichoic acid export membrane protein
MSGDGLKARAQRAVAATLFGFGGGQLMRLASNLILTRLLFPEAFGLMALLQVFLTGLEMLSDLGVGPAVVQHRRGDDPGFLNTAWTLQILRGGLLWLVACAIAPLAAGFYEQDLLLLMLPVAGLNLLISGFVSIGIATASRHLRLGRLTWLDLGVQAFGVSVTVLLAYLTASVWALVFGALISTLARTMLSHLILPGPPLRLRLERDATADLINFGKFILLSSLAGFLFSNVDRILLGKFVTLPELAVYNIGFFMASVPLTIFRQIDQKVMMPLFVSRPPAEGAANRHRISRARYLLSGATISLLVVLGLVGDWLVRVLYDPRYHAAGPILVLMAAASLPKVVTGTYGSLMLSRGNSRGLTLMVIALAVAQATFTYIGIREWGLLGVILAPVPTMLVIYPLTVALVRGTGGWDPLHDILCTLIGLAAAILIVAWNFEAVASLWMDAQGR